MNRLHIAFADNGGLVRVPLIVPEGQGGEPWVPETVQASGDLLRGHAASAAILLRKFGISDSVAEFLENAVAEYDAAIAQEDTE